ncbi:unnamed protein product [Prorocentrum cordatum]|uniref:Glycosyl transferase family 1 domain-containing protein n=1 Tax=Prorocentrum cordatum TaxID=2364126 RepID=A0ABN9QE75_9DINO|nr:unnamed protein product [Polarella glacialis]
MEAMASGLPTIATGWGGNTEFMHAGNAVLLGYRLVGAPHGAGTHRWAEPERPALRQAMQDAVTRSATLRSLAEHACEGGTDAVLRHAVAKQQRMSSSRGFTSAHAYAGEALCLSQVPPAISVAPDALESPAGWSDVASLLQPLEQGLLPSLRKPSPDIFDHGVAGVFSAVSTSMAGGKGVSFGPAAAENDAEEWPAGGLRPDRKGPREAQSIGGDGEHFLWRVAQQADDPPCPSDGQAPRAPEEAFELVGGGDARPDSMEAEFDGVVVCDGSKLGSSLWA